MKYLQHRNFKDPYKIDYLLPCTDKPIVKISKTIT